MNNNKLEVEKDLSAKKMIFKRYFDATPDLVWRAWTEPELLDRWWSPYPYRMSTKQMDFRVGGFWLYAMTSPEGESHWCRADYLAIDPGKSYSAKDSFCEENGFAAEEFPGMHWNNHFVSEGQGTMVHITIQFKSEEHLEKIAAMGFREGFTAAMTNLEAYLCTMMNLRKERGQDVRPRTAHYLNFAGKTEAAMLFYQSVFNGHFRGSGLRRFGDIEMPAEMPPMDADTKRLIIHAELEILPGHYLMATDAPESMGFKLVQGNNMHINIEPSSREEALRLFNALSEGGEISMPMEDMFWGAYYGAFRDQFGINWMIHYQD